MNDDDNLLFKEFQNLLKHFNLTHKNLKKVIDIFENQIGLKQGKQEIGKSLGVSDIMQLPDDLRKTALVVIRLRKNATVDKISERTKRDKTLEKGFAEALVAMGFLKRDGSQSNVIYKPNLGKRKPLISDNVWELLIKDSAEMVNFICNMEIEKAELKILDIEEMAQLAPQLSDLFNEIKESIYNYVSGLNGIKERISN